uniref:Uncharacterized protein n=1 Tax=Lepeophtheirus salmonis TaxID=72036 RepID=A0A0K2V942_LEPSM
MQLICTSATSFQIKLLYNIY